MAQRAENPETGEKFILIDKKWKPFKEDDFQRWYGFVSRETGIDPNPDDPLHKYDYRAAYASGFDPLSNKELHWPSQFKAPDHPNRYVVHNDKVEDTITGKKAKEARNPESGQRFYLNEGTKQWIEFEYPGIHPARTVAEGTKDVARSSLQFVKGSEQARDTGKEASRFGVSGRRGPLQSLLTDQMRQDIIDGRKQGLTDEQALEAGRGKMLSDLNSAINSKWLKADGTLKRPEGYKGYIQDVLKMFPQIASQVALTVTTGPVGGGAFMATQIGGSDYENFIKQGVEPKRAFKAAVMDAIAQTPLEQIGMGKALSLWKPGRFTGRFVKGAAEAGFVGWLTETLQQYPQVYSEIWAKGEGLSNQRRLNQFFRAAWDTFKEGAYQGLVAAPYEALIGGTGAGLRGRQTSDSAPAGISRNDIFNDLVNEQVSVDDLIKLKSILDPKEAAEVDAAIESYNKSQPLFPPQTPEEQKSIENDILRQRATRPNNKIVPVQDAKPVFPYSPSQELQNQITKEWSDFIGSETPAAPSAEQQARVNNQREIDRMNIAAENEIAQNEMARREIAQQAEQRRIAGQILRDAAAAQEVTPDAGKIRSDQGQRVPEEAGRVEVTTPGDEGSREGAQAPVEAQQGKGGQDIQRPEETGRGSSDQAAGLGGPEPIVKTSPLSYRPPGNRWETDAGAIPGEPAYILDGGKAAIIENQVNGNLLFEAVLDGGQSIGEYQTIDAAAKSAEKAVDELSTRREPWQMTRNEFQTSRATGNPPILNARDGKVHENIVALALNEGKAVPERVLKNYPWLKKPAIQKTETSQQIPLDQIMPRHPQRDMEKLARGRELMDSAERGQGPARKPISVYQRQDGKYVVLEGNTTYHLLKERGATEATAEVRKTLKQQNVKDLTQLYENSKKFLKDHRELTEQFAKDTKGESKYRPEGLELKSRERASEKEKAYGSADRLKDVLASSIIFKNEKQLRAAVKKIGDDYHVVELENRWDNPTADGYRDFNMVVSLGDGEYLAEIQLMPKPMFDAKMGVGHDLYEIGRKTDDPQVRELISRLSKKVYAEASAWNSDQPFAITDALASEIGTALESMAKSKAMGTKDFGPSIRNILSRSRSIANTNPSDNLNSISLPPSETNIGQADESGKQLLTEGEEINNIEPKGQEIKEAKDEGSNARTTQGTEAGRTPDREPQPQQQLGTTPDLADGQRAGSDTESVSDRPAGTVQPDSGRGAEGQPAEGNTEGAGQAGSGSDQGSRVSDSGTERRPIPAGESSPTDRGTGAKQDSRVESKPLKPEDRNHVIGKSDVIFPRGPETKIRSNIKAIRLLKKLEQENRNPTPAEKKILAQYVGWGQFSQKVFNTKYDRFQRDVAENPDQYFNKPQYRFPGGELEKYQNWLARYGKKLHPDLGGLMTREEWDSAAESTQNAHYTSPEVIDAMWQMAKHMGFEGGTVAEPAMGVGHFFGLMPQELSEKSRLVGVELDSLSARIAQKLYPQAHIQQTGFEKARGIPDNSVDLVISNFPFGRYSVYDAKHKQYSKWSIHNYFFGRSIDAVRPGGLVMAITSHWTMDAVTGGPIREILNSKADLVGAIRLPATAFKQDAGTEVTTDILIFRKKDGTYGLGNNFRVVKPVPGAKDIDVNEYFVDNPEMVLGKHSLKGTMRSGENEYSLLPHGNLEERLAESIKKLPADIAGEGSIEETAEKVYADINAKEGVLTEKNGKLYVVEDGLLVAPKMYNSKGELVPALNSRTRKQRARSYLQIKEAARELITQSQSETATDQDIEALRVKLNDLYDKHVEKYNQFGDQSHSFLRHIDNEFPIVDALEDENSQIVQSVVKGKTKAIQKVTYTKAAILQKRTIWPFIPPTSAENIDDALKISRIYRGRVDLDHMADLLGTTRDNVKKQLIDESKAYENPETGLVEAPDEYLSGNVKKKLKAAMDAGKGYENNVKALEAVIPDDIDIDFIHFKLGTSWVPAGAIQDFIKETMGVDATVTQARTGETASWVVRTRGGTYNAKNRDTWGAEGKTGVDLVVDSLNLKRTIIMEPYYDGDTRKYRQNKDKSIVAQAKQKEIQEEFRQWARGNDKWSTEMSAIFNREMNGTVLRAFEVPDIERFPGASPDITLRPTQKRFVYRGLQESYLAAHGVGTGKTFSYVSLAMEMRRLKTARKPLIVVQNSTVRQYAAEFKALYPQSKVLIPLDTQRKGKQRKKLLIQIATGDWDAVVLPHSFFDGIADDPAREMGFVREQLDEIEAAIRDAENGDGDQYTVKELKAMRKRKQAKLEKLLDRRKDDALTFEQLGVDALLIDEAHAYKRSEFFTKMGNVKGIDNGSAQRSTSLLLKARYVQSKTGGKNVILATGTPISNTTAELWTMLRYVRPDLLKEYNCELFDDFAANFGDTSITVEETETGTFKEVERFNKYVNGPELLSMFHTAADVVLTQQANLNLPSIEGGKAESIDIPRYDSLTEFIDALRLRRQQWENLTGREKRAQRHVPLVLFGQAKKAAVDLRLVDPEYYQDEPGSKLNEVVKNAYDIWNSTKADRLTQVIFLDTYQSSDKSFNAHNDIKQKLVKLGIPESEVIVVKDASDIKRDSWFQAIRDGRSRVIIGTTPRLGIGVNIQDRLYAAHHVDAPLRPMDIEQRNGRIVREKNMNNAVRILNYGVKNTLDSVMYDRLVKKQKFIDQMLTGDIEGRSFDEPLSEEQVSFAEMNAAFAGNPLLFEKSDMTVKVKNLRVMKNSWQRRVSKAKKDARELRSVRIPAAKNRLNENIALVDRIKKAFPDGKVTEIDYKGQTLDPKDAIAKIDENVQAAIKKEANWLSGLTVKTAGALTNKDQAFHQFNDSFKAGPYDISITGNIRAYFDPDDVIRKPSKKIDFNPEKPFHDFVINIAESGKPIDHYSTPAISSGIITKINNTITKVSGWPDESRKYISNLEKDLSELEGVAGESFKDEQALIDAERRLAEIDAGLQAAAGTTTKQAEETQQVIEAKVSEGQAIYMPEESLATSKRSIMSELKDNVADILDADLKLSPRENADLRARLNSSTTPRQVVQGARIFMGYYGYELDRERARVVSRLRRNAQERIDQAALTGVIGEPIGGIPKGLAKALQNILNESGSSQLYNDIINSGIEFKSTFGDSYRKWRSAMRKKFSQIWDKIASQMRWLWKTLKSQGGSVKIDRSSKGKDDTSLQELKDRYRKGAPAARKKAAQQKQKPAPQRDEFLSDNQVIKGRDKNLWAKAARIINYQYRRQLRAGGLLPRSVFAEKIVRDSEFAAVEFDISHMLGVFEKAVKKDYGKPVSELDEATQRLIADGLAGTLDPGMKDATKSALVTMRRYIDSLSRDYAQILFQQAKDVLADGNTEQARAKVDLLNTIAGNLGQYVHRSYQAFDDKNWYKKVSDQVLNDARAYFISRYIEQGMTQKEAATRASVTIDTILKSGTAADSMESFVRESKLGAKDLSVLKHRKNIAPEIRALLGEYTDPRINFAKSATKMGRLIWNQRFLDKVKEIGTGSFLFSEEDKPLGATKKIAAEQSEVFSPLNGLWTFPEIDQAFKDALGKENFSTWVNAIVRFNGLVKGGKTVLSPTTAARNWQSAMLFSLANGHFNLLHMKKSLSGLREYFTHGGRTEKLQYLRELKQLGVVYDTPYAGEMVDLIKEFAESNFFAPGAITTPFKETLKFAQKFYQYGDDFWKIIGFENEKASLIDSGMSEQDAKKEAAERVRNTYPTYSMVGRFVQKLRRFPLAGTFVSFPSEIIRTSYHILRYAVKDMNTPGRRAIGLKRIAGMVVAAGAAHALQAISKSMVGVDDEEEEATRVLAAPWNKNSNIWFTGRNANGNLRYIDLSYVDPYNYWKRPITAIMRDQPWEQKLSDVMFETFEPFFGVDITAQAVYEVVSNKRIGSGSRIWHENDLPWNQLEDISGHLFKRLGPGFVSNIERTLKSIQGEYSPSGKKYDIKDEAWAWAGWRLTTLDPKVALYYRSYDFKDSKSDALKDVRRALNSPNKVTDAEIKESYDRSMRLLDKAYNDMALVVSAALKSGMSKEQVIDTLRNSKISLRDLKPLVEGEPFVWKPSKQEIRSALHKARAIGVDRDQIRQRYEKVKEFTKP